MNTIKSPIENGQWEKLLNICADVSKRELWWRTEDEREGHIEYKAQVAMEWMKEQTEEAKRLGYSGVRLAVEPTGHYHKRILALARKVGWDTALVSGEHVHRAQLLEDNTTGKSDWKDPRTMQLLVAMKKTFKDRQLGGEWRALRELNADHENTERVLTAVKNKIHAVYDQLFPELSFGRDWRFEGEAVREVVRLYGMDPFVIVKEGKGKLDQRLGQKKVLQKTIDRLWEDANRAVQTPTEALWREVKVGQLKDRYEELEVLQRRRKRIREQMVRLLEVLQQKGEIKLRATEGLIGPVLLARIFAETGPMSDFKSARALLKYAGMNLRPKQSGRMKGRDRQGKRGRARLRMVIGQAVLKLVVKEGLYGEYYHRRKAEGMPGPVAMTAVARKYLKLLYGLERTGQVFDPKRVFECKSEYAKAA